MVNLLKSLFEFIGRLVSADPTASSKRLAFLAVVFAGIVLMYITTISDNQLLALGTLLTATSLTAITGKNTEKDVANTIVMAKQAIKEVNAVKDAKYDKKDGE